MPIELSNESYAYRSSYKVSGNTLNAERELVRHARELLKAHAAQLVAFYRAIQSDIAQKVGVSGSIRATPALPDDATASELYSAGYAAFNQQNYEAALAIWRRTAEVNPKMAEAWSAIGLTHARLGQYTEAAAALEKQAALVPFDKRAHADLADIYRRSGNRAAAAGAYARHIELNPLDGSALTHLGELYLDLQRAPEAVPVLQKAIQLAEKDGWPHALLGGAYLAVGQIGKAREAFDKALEITPEPWIWTKVAYYLAEHRVDLDRASDLARRTLGQIAERTRELKAPPVEEEHFELMERLAWAWDALGLVYLARGDLDRAERFLRAAWLLAMDPRMAEHLGLLYEKRGRSADALSAYLMAWVADPLAASAREHATRLAGTDTLDEFLSGARLQVVRERSISFPGEWPTGKAEYVLVLRRDGRCWHKDARRAGRDARDGGTVFRRQLP